MALLEWLSTPDEPELLASGDPYFYLGGRLIAQGLVDVSECVSGGLQPNGYADTCGLEKSKGMILPWQNQFDQGIIDVAKQTGIPAQLMKNLFAQESQFWPGVFRVPYEYGLGQITDMGADLLLFWNESFYEQFCPLVLTEETCATDYMNLDEENQALLRGALALQADFELCYLPRRDRFEPRRIQHQLVRSDTPGELFAGKPDHLYCHAKKRRLGSQL